MFFKIIFSVLLLSACSGTDVSYNYPEKVRGRYEMPTKKSEKDKQDTLFDNDKLVWRFNEDNSNTNLETKPVAKPIETLDLWSATLPVLSAYPISDIQETFMMTEWFSVPEKPYHQIKINALKQGLDVKITVLVRFKSEKSGWINQNNDATLAVKIKNDIVKQAKR